MNDNSKFPYILETHLVDHCNINCRGCSHFSPLVDGKVFTDIDIFKRDITRLRQLFQDVYEIRLMGGEPLLHPEINTFCEFARQIFPKSNISIFTNGALLLKMPDDFWKTCAEKNILVKITKYPINLKLKIIKRKADSHNVRIKIPKQINFFFQFINIKGDSDPDQSFRACRTMYTTPFLRDGKLYSCSFTPHAHIFNQHFNQQIHVSRNDYINILADVSAAEIFDFLDHPIPMCKWCLTKRTYIDWGRSKYDIDEWITGKSNNFTNFFQMKKHGLISVYHHIKRVSEMQIRKWNEN
jgi:MoaA/NifB/PqqE/SkfB family radical SAM enzyme